MHVRCQLYYNVWVLWTVTLICFFSYHALSLSVASEPEKGQGRANDVERTTVMAMFTIGSSVPQAVHPCATPRVLPLAAFNGDGDDTEDRGGEPDLQPWWIVAILEEAECTWRSAFSPASAHLAVFPPAGAHLAVFPPPWETEERKRWFGGKTAGRPRQPRTFPFR
jgi:hypothetical protein